QTHISQPSGSGADEGIGSKPGVPDVPTDEEEESVDPIPQTPESSEDEGNSEEDQGLNIGEEERHVKEEEEDKLYRDVNINQGRGLQASLKVEDSHVTLTSVILMFAGAVSAILGIVQHYMDQRMNEAVKVIVKIQSDRLRDEAQRENDEFLRNVDENIKKIIKEQVKEQVKALVDAYESDKLILDTYGEIVTLKRRRDDDADKDEEPFAGPDRGSKRHREGKEP
nr:hypothetical protein [Tanacetum cinerariifolium]